VKSRSALIVANGEYQNAKLRGLRAPAQDADALARVLEDPVIGDFDVELVRDQPEHVLRRRLARFFADRRRDDLLLLHISCHGLKDDDGHLFFAASDTEIDDLDSTAVPEEFVQRQMAKSRSGRIVLLLDCCYSGAFSRGMSARAGEGVELKERFAGRGRAVITASNAMEYSFEGNELSGEGEPSIFTSAVVKALETGQADRDLDGWIAVDELYDYVYDEVCGKSPQHPVKWVDLEGDLRIAKSVYKPPPQPAQLPPDLQEAIESPERHTRLGAVHALGELLAGDNAALRMAVREALEGLARDDSRLVYEAASRTLSAAGPEPASQEDTLETISSGSVSEEAIDTEPEGDIGPGDEIEVAVDEHAKPPSADLTGLRAAGVVAIAGAMAVLASVIPHVHDRQLGNAFYRVPVGLMSAALIALIAAAFRLNRRALLLCATGLALALLGVTVPMSWRPGAWPTPGLVTVGNWGAAIAAAGAGFACWRAYPEDPRTSPAGANPTSSRFTRAVLAVTGPLIVIASIFVLPEWNYKGTTWSHWEHPALHRYPTTMILLCGLTLVLAALGIRADRRRLLVIAVAVACLVLGEAVPFIFPGVADWGAGRWLRIAGAVVAVLGLASVAASTGSAVATSRREGMTPG
jgi:Caspase domain